ncbi:hypothetical protein VNO77_11319 [Canavalia gladiata]|uniref:Uncharacterized protein n=1 Tax=Canavalia gladiata TaxID=3824 RepID=A0AAN9QV84_CANGL
MAPAVSFFHITLFHLDFYSLIMLGNELDGGSSSQLCSGSVGPVLLKIDVQFSGCYSVGESKGSIDPARFHKQKVDPETALIVFLIIVEERELRNGGCWEWDRVALTVQILRLHDMKHSLAKIVVGAF